MLTPLGAEIHKIELNDKILHLKSAISALPNGHFLKYDGDSGQFLKDQTLLDSQIEKMPDANGAHVVVLSEDKVLMATNSDKSTELL